MRPSLISLVVLLAWLAGCAGSSTIKPVEVLDERTGMTVGALREPIELVPNSQNAALISRNHASAAYMGPVEWNRSGTLTYGLWVQIVPGIDRQPGDIHSAAALTLVLADGSLQLALIDAPRLGAEPYHQVVPWGQTAYFGVTSQDLRRMAASPKLDLDVRAADGSIVTFTPTLDSRAVLTQYVQARGITAD